MGEHTDISYTQHQRKCVQIARADYIKSFSGTQTEHQQPNEYRDKPYYKDADYPLPIYGIRNLIKEGYYSAHRLGSVPVKKKSASYNGIAVHH